MFGNPEHSDLVIVLPHKGIYLHKSVLFSACPAMAARSKKAGNKSFLILLEDATIMESILHYVYGAQIPMIFDVEQCQRAIKLLLAAKKVSETAKRVRYIWMLMFRSTKWGK